MTPTGRRAVMLIACAVAIVSLLVILASAGNSDASIVAVFSLFVLLLGLAVLWGMGLYFSAKARAWGWFLNDLLFPGIALPLHALFGPVTLPLASRASFVTSSPWQGGDGDSRWEYVQKSLDLPPGTTGMLMSVRLGTEAQAKGFFSNELNSSQFFTQFIQEQLQREFDHGWQLVNPLGPANIQTRTRRKFTADVVQCILIALATFTIILIPVALYAELFHYRRVYEPSSITITLQRTIGTSTKSDESPVPTASQAQSAALASGNPLVPMGQTELFRGGGRRVGGVNYGCLIGAVALVTLALFALSQSGEFWGALQTGGAYAPSGQTATAYGTTQGSSGGQTTFPNIVHPTSTTHTVRPTSTALGVQPTPTATSLSLGYVTPTPADVPTVTPTPCPQRDGSPGVTFYSSTGYSGQSVRYSSQGTYNLPSGIAGNLHSFTDPNDAWHIVTWQGPNGTGTPGHWDTSYSNVDPGTSPAQSVQIYLRRFC